jgi:hypothetical protein
LEDASLLAGLQGGPAIQSIEKGPAYVDVPQKQRVPVPTPIERPDTGSGDKPKAQTSAQQRTGPSSYWSVPEVNDFPKNMAHFGTDWTAIANHMKSKTATMVRHFVLCVADSSDHSTRSRITICVWSTTGPKLSRQLRLLINEGSVEKIWVRHRLRRH